MSTKNWQRAAHDAEQERDNALAQLAHERAHRREWQTQYQAEHRDYLNDVEADRDRLRDGIKALIDEWERDASEDRDALARWTAEGRPTAYFEGGITMQAALRIALRALLDGEAKR